MAKVSAGEQDDRPEVAALLERIKQSLPELERLLEQVEEEYEDVIYRFYHQSFKIHRYQELTKAIVKQLGDLSPNGTLTPTKPFSKEWAKHWFFDIISEGTSKEFSRETNENWLPETRPILEAFFHAHYFLKMAVKYGKKLRYPPMPMPSGWAALLYIYNLR